MTKVPDEKDKDWWGSVLFLDGLVYNATSGAGEDMLNNAAVYQEVPNYRVSETLQLHTPLGNHLTQCVRYGFF